MLVVLQGNVKVKTDDGQEVKSFLLSCLSSGLVIPPMTWATQDYETDGSALLVLCDQLFDEEDYIRDRKDFLTTIERGSIES